MGLNGANLAPEFLIGGISFILLPPVLPTGAAMLSLWATATIGGTDGMLSEEGQRDSKAEKA